MFFRYLRKSKWGRFQKRKFLALLGIICAPKDTYGYNKVTDQMFNVLNPGYLVVCL
jgi:hypothetical protein